MCDSDPYDSDPYDSDPYDSDPRGCLPGLAPFHTLAVRLPASSHPAFRMTDSTSVDRRTWLKSTAVAGVSAAGLAAAGELNASPADPATQPAASVEKNSARKRALLRS